MSAQTRGIFSGWVIICLIGCGGLVGCGTGVGDACQAGGDCPGNLCLTPRDGFPGGYCSADCTTSGCGPGQDCRPVGERAVCLVRCTDAGACRPGYQCHQGVCQPACRDDASCGNRGYVCKGGACVERPGAKLGAPCTGDSECSSTACIGGRCVQLCEREAACPEGQTCTLDRTAEELRTYCVARRGGSAPLAACRSDAGCDRGSCLAGVCLTVCQTPSDCGSGRACGRLPAPLEKLPLSGWPELRACLPRNQNLMTDISEERTLLVPDSARSVLLFMSVDGYDEQTIVGLQSFRTTTGRSLFQLWNENDPTGYFRNAIRHHPDVGCSSFLFSSSPQRAPVRMGPYPFRTMAEDVRGNMGRARVQAIYKLFDGPIQKGRMALRIHITNLSGLPTGCRYRDLRASNAEQMLSVMLQRAKEIFAQGPVGIQLDPISFVDSSAPSSVSANTPGSLENVLRTASMDTAGGADLVLLRTISPNSVLGIAGGIPGSPGIKGTPHTGAVVSMLPLCLGQFTQEAFAVTVAHELGHTLGLSHNREQNGQSDPLGDGNGRSESYLQNTTNLMYWAEGDNPGSLLTAEQGDVLRHMPQVQP